MGHFPGKSHHEGHSLSSCSTRAHTSGQEGCSGSLKWPRLGAMLSSEMISQKPLPVFPVPRGGRNQTFGQLTELHHVPPTPPLPANPTTSRPRGIAHMPQGLHLSGQRSTSKKPCSRKRATFGNCAQKSNFILPDQALVASPSAWLQAQ